MKYLILGYLFSTLFDFSVIKQYKEENKDLKIKVESLEKLVSSLKGALNNGETRIDNISVEKE